LGRLAELRAVSDGSSPPAHLARQLRDDLLVITTDGRSWSIEPAVDPIPERRRSPQHLRMSFVVITCPRPDVGPRYAPAFVQDVMID
jgi:hypothetical protein